MALMQAVRRKVSVSFVQLHPSLKESAAGCGHGSLGGLGRSDMLQVGYPISSPPLSRLLDYNFFVLSL